MIFFDLESANGESTEYSAELSYTAPRAEDRAVAFQDADGRTVYLYAPIPTA